MKVFGWYDNEWGYTARLVELTRLVGTLPTTPVRAMKLEVRIHGRGGQGVVTAAELLSMAAFDQGLHAQAFPSFGSERTGAPVVAFCRIDDDADPVARPGEPPGRRGGAGPDPAARRRRPRRPGRGRRRRGQHLRDPGRSRSSGGLEPGPAQRWVTVPATDLSRELLGRPLPNTALLGAVAGITDRAWRWKPSPARSAVASPARARGSSTRTSGWPRRLVTLVMSQARGSDAMLRQLEGSRAVAETVARCRPHVVAAYPISPQTHIVEALSELVAAGELAPCEYLMVESEFGALSACIGASAAGARAYTATASQGLLFMAEALPNASGLGLPIVMTVANRALGRTRSTSGTTTPTRSPSATPAGSSCSRPPTRRPSTCTCRPSPWPSGCPSR